MVDFISLCIFFLQDIEIDIGKKNLEEKFEKKIEKIFLSRILPEKSLFHIFDHSENSHEKRTLT